MERGIKVKMVSKQVKRIKSLINNTLGIAGRKVDIFCTKIRRISISSTSKEYFLQPTIC